SFFYPRRVSATINDCQYNNNFIFNPIEYFVWKTLNQMPAHSLVLLFKKAGFSLLLINLLQLQV
ncbi:MAG: hypothetical protein BWK80_36670, partial [Desulfobacteraceae bacterium IS3]